MDKKKLLLLLALLAVVLWLVLRNQPQNEAGSTETPADASETELVILSVNDMHANIDLFPKFAAIAIPSTTNMSRSIIR